MNHRVLRNGTPLDARHDNIAKALAREGYRPTLFGYTAQAVDPRPTTADDPRLATYEAALPCCDVAVKMPGDTVRWCAWRRASGHTPPDQCSGMSLPGLAQRRV